jgi:hypothetical protein
MNRNSISALNASRYVRRGQSTKLAPQPISIQPSGLCGQRSKLARCIKSAQAPELGK